jgi:type II secretory pathway pseudopilin PulG
MRIKSSTSSYRAHLALCGPLRIFGSRELGISLIETVVALAILGTIAVSFLSGLAISTKNTFIADEVVTARSLAQSQIEWIKDAPYNAIGYSPPESTEEYYTNYSTNVTANLLGDGIQKITVIVKHFDKVMVRLEDYKVNR